VDLQHFSLLPEAGRNTDAGALDDDGPVVLPDDPTGIAEPHDVLAAEEFALPAPAHRVEEGAVGRRRPASAVARGLGAGLTLLVALRLLRASRKR